jgi:hypothetical protein
VVLLLIVVFTVVVLLGVVILIVRVELLPLGIVSDEVSYVATLKAAPRWSAPLLVKHVQDTELSRQQRDLVVGDAFVLLIRSCN